MLFNKLCGQRLSIVEDTPGVTRDRLYAQCEWRNRTFDIVDTGGIEPGTDDQILSFMREQAEIAISTATVIVFVCDVKTGMTASDQEVANMLLRSGKPVVLAVNKADQVGRENPDVYEFYNLGLGDPIAVSAVHGHGTGDLLDACLQYFPPEDEEEEDSDVIQVAIIGKPNVGKSSLTNRILGQQRVIVSNVAGTTRDAIDSYFENETGKYNFIDTAGMRKKSKVDDNIEKYSVLRATMAIEPQRCVPHHDRCAGRCHGAGYQGGGSGPRGRQGLYHRGEQVGSGGKGRQDHGPDAGGYPPGPELYDLRPIVFISALTGQRVTRLFELINYVREQSSMRITTGMLNSVLADAQTVCSPPRIRPPPEDLLYDAGGIRPPHLWCSATIKSSSTSPIAGIWKIRSAACSGWRGRPSS